MTYDIQRMMRIAGIPDDEDSSVLTENKNDAVVLSEASIRDFIRQEVKSILTKSAAFNPDVEESDSKWIYGSGKQPKMSRRGHVHMGLLGLGFK